MNLDNAPVWLRHTIKSLVKKGLLEVYIDEQTYALAVRPTARGKEVGDLLRLAA